MRAEGEGPGLSDWSRRELEAGGWVRRMFAEGQRLRALHGDDAVVDMALGQPLGEPAAAVLEAIRAAAAERDPGRFAYMPNAGYAAVRERAAEDAGHPGLDGRHVVMTGGAAAAISLALRAFVDPGDSVLGVSPYFAEYRAYCAAAGARWVPVDSTPGFGLDLGAIAAALSPDTAAIVLNTPCNPTGHVIDGAELAGLAALLDDHARAGGRRVVLIVDEVYRRLVYPPAERADPLTAYPWTALARSFSKDLGLAGERIGYLALHPELGPPEVMHGLELAQRALGFVNAPATMQRMLLHLRDWGVDLRPHRARRDEALARLGAAGLDCVEPAGGLYIWARSPWEDDVAFVQELARRRVLIAPGVGFGSPGWLRFCFTAPAPAIETAAAMVAEVAALRMPA